MRLEAAATVALNGFGASDAGRVRPRNEDRFHVDLARGIFIVVDGVGGHAGGDLAAEIALEALRTRLERDTGSIPERLREAIASANEAIHDESAVRPQLAGMACVLTAAVISGERLFVGHVGDTRLYKLCGGAMVKLTHDHSPVGALEDSGQIGEQEAMRHPRRHEVWRDVGTAAHRPEDPDFIEIVEDAFEPDAALLLCSDGLTDLVGSADIASMVYSRAGSPALAVRDLIAAANEAGGRDNITAIVVEGPDFQDAARVLAGGGSSSRHGAGGAVLVKYVVAFALGAALATGAFLWRDAVRLPPLPPPPAGLHHQIIRATADLQEDRIVIEGSWPRVTRRSTNSANGKR